jgi:hypothetical protein
MAPAVGNSKTQRRAGRDTKQSNSDADARASCAHLSLLNTKDFHKKKKEDRIWSLTSQFTFERSFVLCRPSNWFRVLHKKRAKRSRLLSYLVSQFRERANKSIGNQKTFPIEKRKNKTNYYHAHKRLIKINLFLLFPFDLAEKEDGTEKLLEFDAGSSFVNVVAGWDNEIQTPSHTASSR